ncbi:hypothetical protein [Xanthobacter tagetidis]|uniref:hypothetical protein n=1 Tax=Xanthobacter tagetidis TaxID=60216 RepID=UPI0011C48244|nr:hypothetical protein [Xanthobacter tagetidis]MBB6308685.1 hypothetical protein [Xanthobacter tagetidis]
MFALKLLHAALAYMVVSVIFFGSVGQPLNLAALAILWPDRLGLPLWGWIAVLCLAASTLIFAIPLTSPTARVFRLPMFVALAIVLPTTIVGLYADSERRRGVRAFGADEVEENSFFTSIREAPQDFQFVLHTAALKGCTPYAWSYRTQSFYKLPPDAAVNVLPQRWIAKCGIARTERH